MSELMTDIVGAFIMYDLAICLMAFGVDLILRIVK